MTMGAFIILLKTLGLFLLWLSKSLGFFFIALFSGLAGALMYVALSIKALLWSLSGVFSMGYPLYYGVESSLLALHFHLDSKKVIIHELLFCAYSPALYFWLRDLYVRHAAVLLFLHFFACWGFALRAAFVTCCVGYLDTANLYEVWTCTSWFYLVRYSIFFVSRKEIMEYPEKQRAIAVRFGYHDPEVLRAEALVLSKSFL